MIQKRKVFFFEILVYLLILLITKLLSFNFSPQEFIRKKVRKSLEISETLPPLEKKRNLDYREILEKRKIKPVKHRKPISKGITCPTCNAPWEYIYIATPEYPLPYRKERSKSIGARYVEDSGSSRQKYSYRPPMSLLWEIFRY